MRHPRRNRVLIRRRNWAVLYRAPTLALVLLVGLVAAIATAAVIADYLLAGAAVIGGMVLAWLGLALRVTRLEPAGGDGPAWPGGAGVREPRRPLPNAPAGAAAMPIPDEEPPLYGAAMTDHIDRPS